MLKYHVSAVIVVCLFWITLKLFLLNNEQPEDNSDITLAINL